MNATPVVLVLCTAPPQGNADGRLSAHDLAQRLVEERLCACVNIVPGVRSVFRWEGRVEAAEELLLIAKTTAERAEALRLRITALHPYRVPEVLEVPVHGGLPDYLAWLVDAVRPEAG